MALGSCYTCIRYLMFAFNFLFWLLGCAILGVGIWVRVDENFAKYANSSEHFTMLFTGAYIFIVVGIAMMVVGFLGCCGAIRENQCMLGLFFASLFVIFVVLLGAGIWAVVAKEEVKDVVNKALQDGVNGYFNSTDERKFMDMVQNDFKCCGATLGLNDYPASKIMAIPACQQYIKFECCGATRGGIDYPSNKVHLIEACQRFTKPCNGQLFGFVKSNLTVIASFSLVIAFILPCNNSLFEFVKENLLIIAGVSIGISVVLILGMIFSMILCCALRDAQID